ncbi:MAG: nickel-dependent hydrogenase large subunit [Candidatus Methanofastidiosa archaeon]|nr:nickel-dependent hydrogenase large subunit [Candidatus Methanofastidiosa archaeon]
MADTDRKDRAEYEVPLGIVHSALLEPFRTRLFVDDETVVDAEITYDSAHRGIERIMEGMPVQKGLIITERICGICSHIHLWNGTRMVEQGLGIEVPQRAHHIRVIGNELERIHSHLLFLGHAFEILGHETFSMRCFMLREPVQNILFFLSGNRVHYTISVIGGIRPRADIDKEKRRTLLGMLNSLEEGCKNFANRALKDSLIVSRIKEIGYLSKDDAVKYGALGPNLRASGVCEDVRTRVSEYSNFDFDIIVYDGGAVLDRVACRVFEVLESIKIIRQALETLPDEEPMNVDFEIGEMGFSTSYNEAARGEIYDSCALDESGRIKNYINRTPSMSSISAMEVSCIGDHLTDASLIIASCDPCLTCTNRITVVDENKGREYVLGPDEIRSMTRRRRI